MSNKVEIKTVKIDGKIHAGEFTHNGSLYCAAVIPTMRGFVWALEKQITQGKWINEWETVSANFRLSRGILTVTW